MPCWVEKIVGFSGGGRCQARGLLASGRQAAGRVKRAVTVSGRVKRAVTVSGHVKRAVTVSGHDFFRPDSTR